MKKRQTAAIFAALTLTVCSTALAGCAGRVYTVDGTAVSQEPVAVSSTPAVTEPSEEEPSEEESSEEESSEEESSEEENSAEESSEEEDSEEESSEEEDSEEESSEEESSEEESSEEESSEEEEVNGIKITFVKPDDWGDNIKAYVYNDDQVKNADWPGLDMTDNGDGTYSYVLTDEIENPLVIFSDPDNKRNQYPRARGLEVVDGTTYEVE